MGKLDEIQTIIHSLSKEEIIRLREWFDEFEGDMWDKEFESNVKDGKLDARRNVVRENHSDGKSKEA